MIQMPESQYGSQRMRQSQLQLEGDDANLSTRRRNFLSPTFSQNLPLFRELQARVQAPRQDMDSHQSVMTISDERIISCHAQLVKSLLFIEFLLAFFFIYVAYMYWKFSHRYVLLQLWIQDLATIFILIYYNYRKGDDCIWQLIETMFLFFFKIFIVFYYEVQLFKIYFISIMMLAVSTLLLIMKLMHKLKHPTKTSSELIIQFLKTMCALQILLITLKWEKQLVWSWVQVFLLVWVFQVVCALLLLISLVSCIEALVGVIQKKVQCQLMAGNVWILLMLIGFTLYPFMFLVKLTTFYEDDQSISLNDAAELLILIGFYAAFIVAYTLCFYNQIKQYLKEAQGIPVEVDQNNSLNSPARQGQPKKLDFVKLNMPLFLIKLSCTYFAVLDKAAFDFKMKQTPMRELESGRSAAQSSTVRETFRKMLNQPQCSNSLVENRNKEIPEMEAVKPSVTDHIKPIEEEQPSLHQEIKSVEESSFSQEKCLVCFENVPNIVFVPCRHGGICQQCAEDVIQKSNECYLCRKTIQQLFKVTRNDKKELQVQEASVLR